jgi:hypothetical protein
MGMIRSASSLIAIRIRPFYCRPFSICAGVEGGAMKLLLRFRLWSFLSYSSSMSRGVTTSLALLCIVCAVAAGWFLDWYSQLQGITELHHAIQAQHLRNCDDDSLTFEGRVIWSSPKRYSLEFPVNDSPDYGGVSIETSSSLPVPSIGSRLKVEVKARCKPYGAGILAWSEVNRLNVSP